MKKTERRENGELLFYQLSDFLIYDSGWYVSESALFLDLERLARPEVEHIGADAQFYRKQRRGELTQSDVFKWVTVVAPRFTETNLTEMKWELKDYISGEGSLLHGFISGIRMSYPPGEIQNFFDFVCALCLVDGEFAESRVLRPQEVRNILPEASKWLLIDSAAANPRRCEEYKVARVLHWTSLLELYLRICIPEISKRLDSGPRESMLDPFLPKLDVKGALRCSVDLYMDNLILKLLPNGCKKVDFYRAMVRARSDKSNLDKIDPQVDSIKQADKRLRKGQKALTMEWIDENVGDLAKLSDTKGIDEKDFDLVKYLIPFINMFDFVQRQLMIDGVPEDLIVELFSRYHIHRRVVQDRYEKFKHTGAVCHTV